MQSQFAVAVCSLQLLYSRFDPVKIYTLVEKGSFISSILIDPKIKINKEKKM